MDVKLEPRPELVAEPEYWPTEVVGCRGEVVEEVVTPFEIQVPLADLSKGTKGIELIGDDQTQCLDV